MSRSSTNFDSISLEIHWARLISMVDEAAATFRRTSFSTLVRESNDFAVVLTDDKGRSLAQSSLSIPSFIGTLPETVKHFLGKFPASTLRADDYLFTNDPWLGTGHVYDVSGAMPIFHRSRLVGFAAVVSHLPDIGGRIWGPGARDIYEEGMQLPLMKLLHAGVPDASVVEIIEQNVRVPEQTMGDLWGQVAACRMLVAGLVGFLDETGVNLVALGAELRRRSETAMRTAIKRVPDGEYHHVVQHDGFEQPITIDCTVRIKGSELAIDYSGSSPQIDRAVNVVPVYTFAYSAYAVKAIIEPEVPNNEGSFQPMRTWAPEGSVLNPRYPAATGGRGMIGHMLPPAIMGALSEVLPDRVWAEGSSNCSFSLSGEWQGRRYAVINFSNAGQGATSKRNGFSALSFPSNLGNNPIEVMETLQPIMVLHRSLRKGSGGKGDFRGGDGQSVKFEFTGDQPATIAFMATRRKIPARGANGGGDAKRARVTVNGKPIDYTQQYTLNRGDQVILETGGGGGRNSKSD
jgi:N-methylhydantoinase B